MSATTSCASSKSKRAPFGVWFGVAQWKQRAFLARGIRRPMKGVNFHSVTQQNARPERGRLNGPWLLPLMLLALAIGSTALSVYVERRSRAFCAALASGQSADSVEAAARQADFDIYRFRKPEEGVLLARHYWGVPPDSFNCEVRYDAGRVRSAVFFSD